MDAAGDVWWARLLKKHTDQLRLQVPVLPESQPVTIVSACSGCLPEAAVFKELVSLLL